MTVAAVTAGVIALAAPSPQRHHEPTGPVPACEPMWTGFDDGPAARKELLRLRGLRMSQALCRLLGPGTHPRSAPNGSQGGSSSFTPPDGVAFYEGSYTIQLSYERDGQRDDVSLTISFGQRRATDTCPTNSTCRSGADGSFAFVAHLENGNVLLRAFQPDGTLIIGTVTPAVAGATPFTTDDDLYAVLGDARLSIRSPVPDASSRQAACGQPVPPTAAAICAAMPGYWRHAVITEYSPTFFDLTYLDDAGLQEVQLQIGSAAATSAFIGCNRVCHMRAISVDGAMVARVDGDGDSFVREQAAIGPVRGRAFSFSMTGGKRDEVAVGRLLLAGIRAFGASPTGK